MKVTHVYKVLYDTKCVFKRVIQGSYLTSKITRSLLNEVKRKRATNFATP